MNFYTNITDIPQYLTNDIVVLYEIKRNKLKKNERCFKLELRSTRSDIVTLGEIKIVSIASPSEFSLPISFEKLNKSYFSVGVNLDYYKNLEDVGYMIYPNLLKNLNDLIFDKQLFEKAKSYKEIKDFLIQNIENNEEIKTAQYIFYKKENIKPNYITYFDFNYYHYGNNLKINFDFNKHKYLPYRINAVIGSNGTGKTKMLIQLADALSRVDINEETFIPSTPIFSQVIAISYSYFDEFDKPNSSEDFSYKYYGIRSNNGIISKSQMAVKINDSLHRLNTKDRLMKWKKVLSSIIPLETLEYLITGVPEEVFKQLSSGQNMILVMITNIMANIKNSSLILYDEPELYLHPDAVMSLTKMLYELLEEYDSYAIISTHSPIILQEIPAKYVRVFEKIDNKIIIRPLGIESFGEDLTSITEEVFYSSQKDSLYKNFFNKITQDLSYDEILLLFNNKLSFNAKVYLKTIINNKE
ncbi:Protein ea59 [Paenibacillus nuruki]|uniref:Protein ea59 n=1 Tax=Paenibacillus nuruki TaxID=1886670 RepID=A0A1E3L0E3_9BACL|nr:AAA family ATPase [Paenibacillus nuruki]ODP27258.1 Protein ea59 [Paenibacillus nuruki]